MKNYTVYLTDSLGNKLIMPDLKLIFDITNSYLCKLIRGNKVSTLKELVEVVNRPKKINYAKQTVYIKDDKGSVYTLKELGKIFKMSRSWAYTAYTKFNCKTYADFELRATGVNKPVALIGPTLDISDIPVGSWEKDNYKCPAANTGSSQTIFKEIRHEESGACSKQRWHDGARKAVKRRHVSYAELKEASNMLDQTPVLRATVVRGFNSF